MHPLSGIRVLDLADQSGALAGKLLAGLGADVVLVEPPAGSPLRAIPPFWRGIPDPEQSLFFWFYATGKRSVVLDPADHVGLEALVAAADVVIDTGFPGRADALRKRHPRAVVASITPFGRSGPYATWRSSDTVAQAMGGMAYVSGHADGPPLRSLGLQAYHQAGAFAAIGVVAALLARETTGQGQLVDVSLQAAVAGSLEHVPGLFNQNGRVPHRQGTLHWTRYFRVGRCKDGAVLHCTLGDWTSLFAWMVADGYGTGFTDDAWDGAAFRQEHAEALFDELDRWAANYTVAELYEGAQIRRLPYAAVRPPEALLDDPHLANRGFFVPIEHPDLGRTVPYPGAPFVMRDTPWCVTRAPRLGEHTATVGTSWRAAPRPSRASDHPRRAIAPLAGIRILDLTWVVAGPVTTRILADLGADVIKIERKDALDFGDRRGGLSGTLMRGKRSLVLDLSSPRGVAIARMLALVSDVVIDNFSARVMSNWGLDWKTLATEKPDIISVRMTGYGLTGPDRDKVSYGPTLQALTGYTMLMGEPGRPPAGFGYSYADLASGHLGTLAVLAAIVHRRHTGRGQLVDLAQQEAVASLVGPVLLERALDGGVSVATGNASPEGPAAPHGIYPCRGNDRWIAITVFTDVEWHGLVAGMGKPTWANDPRFATTEGRVDHAAAIDEQVGIWTRTMIAHVALSRLQAYGVPAGLVADAADVCRDDPALAARGHFVDVATEEGRMVRIDGPPFQLSDTPGRVQGCGPLLGEHTDEVLGEILGYDAAAIDALRRDGVVL